MSKNELTRRDFLLRVTAAGALATGSSTLLAACGGGEAEQAAPAEAPAAAEAPATAAASCDDLSGLTEAEVAMRTQLQYVDATPDPAKRCDNCALYTEPMDGGACGGCTIIKGPIAPAGYCVSWSPKQG